MVSIIASRVVPFDGIMFVDKSIQLLTESLFSSELRSSVVGIEQVNQFSVP